MKTSIATKLLVSATTGTMLVGTMLLSLPLAASANYTPYGSYSYSNTNNANNSGYFNPSACTDRYDPNCINKIWGQNGYQNTGYSNQNTSWNQPIYPMGYQQPVAPTISNSYNSSSYNYNYQWQVAPATPIVVQQYQQYPQVVVNQPYYSLYGYYNSSPSYYGYNNNNYYDNGYYNNSYGSYGNSYDNSYGYSSNSACAYNSYYCY